MSLRRFNPMRLLKWRADVRVDVQRALLAIGGVGGVLALTFFFVIRKPAEKVVEQGFGWEWRTGSILVVPVAGDICQQAAFDNDRGVIIPLDPVACAEVIRDYDRFSKYNSTPGHVETVSQTFRR
ncbi:MAG TPA: hypothetical protein VET48_07285 [Steroidobacteraceae bacterium]|nr:hypothetical protein [Steroidobacteraceae bacterium]